MQNDNNRYPTPALLVGGGEIKKPVNEFQSYKMLIHQLLCQVPRSTRRAPAFQLDREALTKAMLQRMKSGATYAPAWAEELLKLWE